MITWNWFDTDRKNEWAIFTCLISLAGPLHSITGKKTGHNGQFRYISPQGCHWFHLLPLRSSIHVFRITSPGGGGGERGNAIYVPYGDVPPIRVYFLAFESETGCLFSRLTLKQGAKFVRSLPARVPIHSTAWHPSVGFNLFVFCPGN